MKATTLQQPHATLVALGVQTIITDKRRAPQALIGQTIAIHAGKHKPHPGDRFGEGWIGRSRLTWPDRMDETFTWGNAQRGAVVLPLGAIVATATLADCVPILLVPRPRTEGDCITECNGTWRHHHDWTAAEGNWTPIEDQRPYGYFRPGRWAWLLTDVKPTTERCPACMGNQCLIPDSEHDGRQCEMCATCTNGTCPPIPAKGKPGLWEWQP